MKLTAQLQLQPTPAQAQELRATLLAANAACDALSSMAWEHQEFGKYGLQKLGYHAVKEATKLTAQVVIRCISKVADAYKLDRKVKREFKPLGSIAYDDRILRYKLDKGTVSIWTVAGRMEIPFVCGDKQRALLATRQGESDLCVVKGKWFLLATCEVEEPETVAPDGVLGVDFGIVEIAVTSEGQSYSGEKVKALRRKTREYRRRLQKCGTKSAKRRLKKAAKRQARFVKDTNHCISKALVKEAAQTKKALALEDLTGIRERSNGLNREMRWQMGNWAFAQLRAFCQYKARKAGVALVVIDPRNTSRACAECGHCEKANRKSQKKFLCVKCGHSQNADANAARNIALRGTVNCPFVSNPGSGTSPLR